MWNGFRSLPVIILLLRVTGQLSDRQLGQGGVTQAGGRGAHSRHQGGVGQLLGGDGEVVVQVGQVTVTCQQVTWCIKTLIIKH